MVTFPCLQVPYYLCNYFPLGLVGEDLAAAGLGWFIPGWALALFVAVLRAQRCLEAGQNLRSGSPAFSPGINSSHSSCLEKWYYLGGSLGHSTAINLPKTSDGLTGQFIPLIYYAVGHSPLVMMAIFPVVLH